MRPLLTRIHRQEPGPKPQSAPINPARGERHGRAKLTDEAVLAIRKRWRLGCKLNGFRALAAEFGVTEKAVAAVIDGRTWRHVTDQAEAA